VWGPAAAGPGGPVPDGIAGRLVPLRPMTVGDVLDGTLRALRATFAVTALLVLLVQGPFQLLSSLAFARVVPELSGPVDLERTLEDPAAGLDLMVRTMTVGTVSGLLGVIVNVALGAAIVWCVLRADRGEPIAVGPALRTAAERLVATLGGVLLALFGATLVGVVGAVLLGLLIVVAPPLGIVLALPLIPVVLLVFAALMYLIPPVAVVEGGGPLATLQRVLWVIGRRLGRVLAVTFLISLLVMAITLGLTFAMGFLAELSGPWAWVVEGATNTVVALVSVPLTVIAALLVYLDARIRLEGFDLELRARGIGTA
jgi:hypothetical protein